MSANNRRDNIVRPALGSLLSNEIVYDRTDQSHNHIDSPEILEEALFRVDSLDRRYFRETVKFDREVGLSHCVETTESDQIILAKRTGRAGVTRFVVDREPADTNEVTVVLMRETGRLGSFVLISAMFGASSREPWDPRLLTPEEKKESKEFWESHALVWDPDRNTIDFSVRITEEPKDIAS